MLPLASPESSSTSLRAALEPGLSMTSSDSGHSALLCAPGQLLVIHPEAEVDEEEEVEAPDNNPYHLMGMASPEESCLPSGAFGSQWDGISHTEQQMIELYEKLGGWELMSAAVQKLYYRLFNDPQTAHYFIGKDHNKLMAHMTCFLTSGLTGRLMYAPSRIYAFHADMIENLGLGVRHVDVMLDHLEEVLQELGVPPEDRRQARRCLSSARHVFVPRRQQAAGPPVSAAGAGAAGKGGPSAPIHIPAAAIAAAQVKRRRFSAWEPDQKDAPYGAGPGPAAASRAPAMVALVRTSGVPRSASTGCLAQLTSNVLSHGWGPQQYGVEGSKVQGRQRPFPLTLMAAEPTLHPAMPTRCPFS